MSFEQFPPPHSDLDAIERFPTNARDNVVSTIVRGFERLEERLNATEARLSSQLAELEDRLTKKNGPFADNGTSLSV